MYSHKQYADSIIVYVCKQMQEWMEKTSHRDEKKFYNNLVLFCLGAEVLPTN